MDGGIESTDEGITWKPITGPGLPPGDWVRIGGAVAPGTHDRRVYALIETKDKNNGLYGSDDGGANWQRTTTDDRGVGYWYMSEIFVDPRNPDVVYVPKQSSTARPTAGKRSTSSRARPAVKITTPCGSITGPGGVGTTPLA